MAAPPNVTLIEDDGAGDDALRNLIPVGLMLAVCIASRVIFLRTDRGDADEVSN